MPGWYKLDRLLRERRLGARHNSLVPDSPSAPPLDNRQLMSYMSTYSLSYTYTNTIADFLSHRKSIAKK